MADINPKTIGQRGDLPTSLAARAGLEISQAFALAGMHEESLGLFIVRVDKDKKLLVSTTPSASAILPSHELISPAFSLPVPSPGFGPYSMRGVTRAAAVLSINVLGTAPIASLQLWGFDKMGTQTIFDQFGYFSYLGAYLCPFTPQFEDIFLNVWAPYAGVNVSMSLSLLRYFS